MMGWERERRGFKETLRRTEAESERKSEANYLRGEHPPGEARRSTMRFSTFCIERAKFNFQFRIVVSANYVTLYGNTGKAIISFHDLIWGLQWLINVINWIPWRSFIGLKGTHLSRSLHPQRTTPIIKHSPSIWTVRAITSISPKTWSHSGHDVVSTRHI